ncbi:MAG TPA: Fe-S cluster assembly protein SufD [Chitinophagales bacterium]|nr:Fe-S cluster assembly protein SufD [Chitinophagales bacterium]
MTTIIETSIYSQTLDELLETQQLPEEIVQKKISAIQKFEELGLPSMKHEEWKYTYLAKVFKKGFTPGIQTNNNNNYSERIKEYLPAISSDKNRLVIVDGIFSKEFSQINTSTEYHISSLADAWENNIQTATELFTSITKQQDRALTALNSALCQDGVFIEVADECTAQIELLLIHTGQMQMSMPRILIQIGVNGYLSIAEQVILLENSSFSNVVSEIKTAEGAMIEWVKIQDPGANMYHFDSCYVQQATKSNYHCTTVSLSGELIRNNQFIEIQGENAHADLGGISILDNKEQTDNLIIIRHSAPNTTSNQLYKNILNGESTGVFNGKIVVDQIAQKTNAFQSNKNILLSDDAAAFFRPQLEIFADDVKCSHGATSYQIEDHELFYLRSRGISKELSRSLLMYAFAADVVEEIEDTLLREGVKSKIASKLKIEF